MRIIRYLILFILLAIVGYYFLETDDSNITKISSPKVNKNHHVIATKNLPESNDENITLEGELYDFIGKDSELLENMLGQPVRVDLSAYSYEWWVYYSNSNNYVQFGIEDDKIKTIFATGDEINIEPLQIGQSYDDIINIYPFEKEVDYVDGVSSYKFKMTEQDLQSRPLVHLSDSVFLQTYFDTYTNELSSIRIMEADILLRMRPYEIVYRGPLPDEPQLDDSEWNLVQAGMEQQIFDITNILRTRFDKTELEWQNELSKVAFLHSKDMYDNQYFSHYSENGNGLKERLEFSDLFYIAAGENIAAQYPDAPAAVEGWLNSEGHRKALLADEYTHLGVGVYRLYYTQNFLVKPM